MVTFTPRVPWADLPGAVRRAVQAALGTDDAGAVLRATAVAGGFSPGCTARLELADGRTVFVKATSSTLNPDSPDLYRREAVVAARLPDGVPAPPLLAALEVDTWVALAFGFVEGRNPHFPWTAPELDLTLEALDRLAACTRGVDRLGIPELESAADHLADMFAGWRRLAADPAGAPADGRLPAGASLARLDSLATAALDGLRGDVLCHLDVRADNTVVGPAGVSLVDWPWAMAGPPWLDALLTLLNVRYGEWRSGGRADTRAADALAAHPVLGTVDADLVTGVLAGMAGFFLDKAREPGPPGLPTLRAFQRDQGLATLAWVTERIT